MISVNPLLRPYQAIKLLLSCAVLNFFLLPPVQARFAQFNEADAQVDLYNISVNVDKSGNCEILQEVQIKILNESGREQLATQTFVYNKGNETIEVIEARSVQDGNMYKVEKNMIQEKTLAGEANGFDDMNRIQIAYPNVAVGSSVYYRIKINRREPIFEGFYEALFYPGGSEYYINSYNLNIKSKLKLNYEVNDPFKKLQVESAEKNGVYIVTTKLKSALFEKLVFEEGFLTDKQRTFLQVSTLDNYEQYVKNIAPQYEKVIKSPLPQIFEDIVTRASQLKNQLDQINYVTSELATKIRYMGDWRTVKGKFFPRHFEEVVTSGFGDCKDFASVTVAMLRKLGYRAFPSLVYRGEGTLFEKSNLVETLDFNHVIAQVSDQEGKILWIDPTNFVSFAGGIFPDIADRPTLVLNETNPELMMIPQIDHESALYSKKNKVILSPNGDSENSGKYLIEGEAAIAYTGAGLIYSQQELNEKFIYALSGEVSPQEINITFPDLTTRVVKNIAIEYSYKIPNAAYQTNLGLAYDMSSSWPETYLNLPKDQVGTVYVGYPKTMQSSIRFVNVNVKSPEALNAEVKTKWFTAKRLCLKEAGDIACQEKVVTLKSFINQEDIASTEFLAAKALLKKYFASSSLIYSN